MRTFLAATRSRPHRFAPRLLPLALALSLSSAIAAPGIFEGAQDIGNPSKGGATESEGERVYRISGGGANMWFTNDSFHFAWKKVSGDFALRAGIDWVTVGGDPHRKACLMVRQSLEANAAYVDVAVHGDGLVSLQFRETAGGPTREVRATQRHQRFAGIERQGEVFFLRLPQEGGELAAAGPSIRLQFKDPVFVGLAVCAHDDKVLETARFSEVELRPKQLGTDAKQQLHCTLETVSIASKDRQAVYHTLEHIEAPNWSRDGEYFLFNSRGRIYRFPRTGGKSEMIDTGFANRCNNDHGLSPDGARLVISDQSQTGKSLMYLLPVTGGSPVQVTSNSPSYWHGWSPDGSTLAYCAERNGEFDVYSIPAGGGQEKRLTTAKGLDDGPDYSPDGKYIYFNSERSGSMQIWRMKPDGSEQEQVTSDDFNNWFPHPSPDGKWLVFLSYAKEVSGHPANQPVWLRLKPIQGGPVQELARLFGGQGTINVPSWSPDSRQVAFVSYQLIYPD